jgi:filamentous hemagglutinin family protein
MTGRSLFAVILCAFVPSHFAVAQSSSIVADGKTQTTVSTAGNVTGVTTSTTRGVNAYNSFSTFNVGAGSTANLFLPSGTTNLLNLVNGSAATINGILNSIKNGQVGGNVFFIDPFGLVVGKTGAINVGALTVATPTPQFMTSFFDASGNIVDATTTAVFSGNIPLSSDGLISVYGRINAISNITLAGGKVTNAGSIGTGAVFVAKQPDFSDVVNVKGLQTGSDVVVSNGNIQIVAAQDFTNSGSISAQGVSGVDGGNGSVRAGNNVTLASGSSIDVSGAGVNSNAGNIDISAGQNGSFQQGALLAARGGDISGNGGSIELSASGTYNLAGGLFETGATNGTAGSVLIDPTETDVTKDTLNPGGSITIQSADAIYVYPGITISTVPTNPGQGTSAGSITLQTTGAAPGSQGPNQGAPSQSINIGACGTAAPCTLNTGSTNTTTLDASDPGGTAGSVVIQAASNVSKTWNTSEQDPDINTSQPSATVTIGQNAVIKGGDVTISATATSTKTATVTADPNGDGSQTSAPSELCVFFGAGTCSSGGTGVSAPLLTLLNLSSEAGYTGGIIS